MVSETMKKGFGSKFQNSVKFPNWTKTNNIFVVGVEGAGGVKIHIYI
jgi:hypothetical protein